MTNHDPTILWDAAPGKEVGRSKGWILDFSQKGSVAWGVFFRKRTGTHRRSNREKTWPRLLLANAGNGSRFWQWRSARLLAVTPDGRYAVQGCLHGLLVVEKQE